MKVLLWLYDCVRRVQQAELPERKLAQRTRYAGTAPQNTQVPCNATEGHINTAI